MKLTNKELIKKYPFLRVRNSMTGKIEPGYKQTYMDWIPDGWRVAFGDSFIEELSQALGDDAKNFRILQIKEKFGGLRFYCNGANNAVYEVINKYARISFTTCINCGNPATKISLGWISPYCDQCADEMNNKLADFMKVTFVPIEQYYRKRTDD